MRKGKIFRKITASILTAALAIGCLMVPDTAFDVNAAENPPEVTVVEGEDADEYIADSCDCEDHAETVYNLKDVDDDIIKNLLGSPVTDIPDNVVFNHVDENWSGTDIEYDDTVNGYENLPAYTPNSDYSDVDFELEDVELPECPDDLDIDLENVMMSAPDDMSGVLFAGGKLEESSETLEYNTSVHSKVIDAIKGYQRYVYVKGYGLYTSNVTEVMYSILNTFPELYYVRFFNYQYDNNTGEVLYVWFTYVDNFQSKNNQLIEKLNKFFANNSYAGMSTLESILYTHEYLCQTVEYAYDDYLNGTMGADVFTIYGVFVDEYAVCQGYAEAMFLIMTRLGIPCGVMTSDAADHAWVIVKLGSNWYHVDPTWDDPVYNVLGRVKHSNFLTSDKGMYAASTNGPKKSDYKLLTMNKNGTYTTPTDTSWDSGLIWHNSNTAFYKYGGLWYYLTVNGSTFTIRSRDLNSGEDKALYSDTVKWKAYDSYTTYNGTKSYSTYSTNFSYMTGILNCLFFSTPDGIKRYNITSGTVTTVYNNSRYEKDIYGFGYYKGKYAVQYEKNAKVTSKSEIVYITNCSVHSWSKYAEDEDYKYYRCVLCNSTKKDVIPHFDATGFYYANKTPQNITVGLTTKITGGRTPEYSWYLYQEGKGYRLLSDWSTSEWLNWNIDTFGDGILLAKVRDKNNHATESSFMDAVSLHPVIKGICQMPYAGGGYLIGIESYNNPYQSYKYEMLILDCTSMQWVYTTTPCSVASGNCLWTVWQPQYGYFWTLFRIYDKNGNLLDEQCYGFVNAY